MKKILFLFAISLSANPTNHSIVRGDITLEHVQPKTLHIHASDKAIIEWDDFSIGLDEMTKFIQPNSNAAVLNRVVGPHLSKLLGTLQSNGQVYLVNPHGLVFGKDAVIDTNSFIASTLDVLNENFLNGSEIIFRGDSQEALINLGTLKASNGDLILIANRLENHGELSAPNGTAALGCASEVLIKPQDQERIYIRTTDGDFDGTGILNTGQIAANSVTLKADGNHFAFAINHEGTIDAFGIQERHGRVLLVAEEGINVIDGTINSKTVHLLGDEVVLLQSAEIDVSGASGGCVLVGGDYQGQNPNISNAKKTYMDKEARIFANAHSSGDGGKVILWADEITGVYGNIEAKGGPLGGDGGFVEVSGKYLDFQGLANRTAPKGNAGTLLLDPSDINVTGATSANVTFGGGCGINTYCVTGPVPSPATIDIAAIIANLALGNVTVTTSSLFGDPGDLTISSTLLYTSPFDLNFIADRDLNVFASVINMGGTGDVVGTAGRDYIGATTLGIDSAMVSELGNTIVNAGRDIILSQGPAQIGRANVVFITSQAPVIVNAGRDLIMDSTSGATTDIGSTTSPTSTSIVAGRNITMTACAAGFVCSASIFTGSDLSIQAGQDMTLNGGAFSSAFIFVRNNVSINVGGSFVMNSLVGAPTARIFVQSGPLGSIDVIAGRDVILNGSSDIRANLDHPITIVVDNNFPTSPLIGPGSFQLGPDATISTGIFAPNDGSVQIFTAVRSQNDIQGLINGMPFVPGPLYVDSISEQWLTYFPNSFGGIPFIVFYKDPFLVQALTQAVVSNVEILRFLNPYNEFINWGLRYTNNYYEFSIPNTDHFIRRRHFKDLNVMLPVYNPDL